MSSKPSLSHTSTGLTGVTDVTARSDRDCDPCSPERGGGVTLQAKPSGQALTTPTGCFDVGAGLTGVSGLSGLSDAHFEKFSSSVNHVLTFILFLPIGIGVSVHKVIVVRKRSKKRDSLNMSFHSSHTTLLNNT